MKSKIIRFFCWSIALIIGFLVGGFLGIVQPGGDGVLGSIQTPDGSEYVIEQSCNWSMEPYTVNFYQRSPAGEWGWCYVDHEASRWKDVEMTYDETLDRIIVTEEGVERAILDRKTQMFWIDNGSIRRDVNAPQREDILPPRFASR